MAKKIDKQPIIEPSERNVKAPEEAEQQSPKEQPAAGKPKENQACGIGGCQTWYDDPEIMKKHKIRQHGIGIENLNKPLPRHEGVKLA